MNTRLVIHLALTETRKSFFFVLALWVLILAMPRDSEIAALGAFFLIARLAMDDHLTRPNSMWQRLPVSTLDWLVSRLALLALWVVLPTLIQQGWVIHQTLLSPTAAAFSLLEAGTMSFLFSVIALAILSLAQRWSSLTAVSAGFVCLIFLLEISVSYGTKKPPGLEWVTSASYYPNPEPRWIVSALTILVAILFLLWYRRVRSLLWGIPIAAAGFAVLYSATLWADQNDFMISTKRAPETFHLADRKMPKGPQTNTQRLYENIQLTGLGRGAFLEPVRIIADGKERYLHKLDDNYYAGVVKGFYRDQALGRHFVGKGDLFRSHGNNIIFSNSYAGIAEAPQLDFNKTIQKAHDDESISRVKVRGEAKKWQLVHEMALQDGTFQSKFNISGRLKVEGAKADPGLRKYALTLYQPRLGFSTDPKMSHHTFGWGRIQDCQIVIFHEKLGECILPGTQNVKAGSVGNIFGSIEENTRKFEIPTNDAWEILWPEGDATEKWLEGARLQIYTTKYVGRFEDEIQLTKK